MSMALMSYIDFVIFFCHIICRILIHVNLLFILFSAQDGYEGTTEKYVKKHFHVLGQSKWETNVQKIFDTDLFLRELCSGTAGREEWQIPCSSILSHSNTWNIVVHKPCVADETVDSYLHLSQLDTNGCKQEVEMRSINQFIFSKKVDPIFRL